MTQATPLISVILPVYNGVAFLHECIDAILSQSLRDFELIIVDDCSTDNSAEIITSYTDNDDRILSIKNDINRGVSHSRNTAIERSTGDFIAFIDADDICMPERFECQLSYMEGNNIDVCGSYIKTIGRKQRIGKYPIANDEIRLNLVMLGRTIATPACMLRRRILNDIRFDNNYRFAEDYDLWLQLALKTSAKFGTIPKVLIHYRLHENQATQNIGFKNRDSITQSLFKNISTVEKTLLKEDIDYHYDILRSKTISPINSGYAATLTLLSQSVRVRQMSKNYWYRLCRQLAKQHLNTAPLHSELTATTSNRLNTIKLNIFIIWLKLTSSKK